MESLGYGVFLYFAAIILAIIVIAGLFAAVITVGVAGKHQKEWRTITIPGVLLFAALAAAGVSAFLLVKVPDGRVWLWLLLASSICAVSFLLWRVFIEGPTRQWIPGFGILLAVAIVTTGVFESQPPSFRQAAESLEHPDHLVRQRGVHEICRFSDRRDEVITKLLDLLNHGNTSGGVRSVAQQSLVQFAADDSRVADYIRNSLNTGRQDKLGMLVYLKELGPAAQAFEPELVSIVNSSTDRNRLWAIEALAASSAASDATVTAYTSALNDRDRSVREQAIQSLESLGELAKPSLPMLREVMTTDPDARCRQLAVRAVRQIEAGSAP